MPTPQELLNYRVIDPHLSSKRGGVVDAVEQIIDELRANGYIKRKSSNLFPACQALILNLYVNHLDEMLTGIHLSTNWFSKHQKPKSNAFEFQLQPFWSSSTVIKLEEHLGKSGLDYLRREAKGYRSVKAGKRSEITKIQGTQKLWDLLEKHGVEPYMIMPDLSHLDDDDLIRLKGKTKPRIQIPTTLQKEARKIRDRLKIINGAMRKHTIALNVSNDELEQLKERRAIKRSKDSWFKHADTKQDFLWQTNLYRVFHRDFSGHGRFYGGFWEALPNKKKWKDTKHIKRSDGVEFRRRIEIDGEPTVEIDYSSLHPRMLYAKKGINYSADPYQAVVDHQPKIEGLPVSRDHAKLATNVLINSSPDMDPVKPLMSEWNRSDSTHKSINKDFAIKLLQAVEATHKPIHAYLRSGAGKDLMNADSRIAERVMLEMIDKHQTVALPVHDSFIVQERFEEKLLEAMEAAFEKETGVSSKSKTSTYQRVESTASKAIQMANQHPISLSEKYEITTAGIDAENRSYSWRNDFTKQLNKAVQESH